MVSDIFTLILQILYLAIMAITFIGVIIAIIAYIYQERNVDSDHDEKNNHLNSNNNSKLVLLDPPLLATSGNRELLMELGGTFSNPHLSWATSSVRTPAGNKNIPFPIFRRWLEAENLHSEIMSRLHKEFLDQYASDLEGSRVYTPSLSAFDFFSGIKSQLDAMKTSIYLLSRFNPPPPPLPKQPVVIFDVVVSTGGALEVGLERLPKSEIEKSTFLFVVLNDFVPPTNRTWPWIKFHANVKFLYKCSELMHFWQGYEQIAKNLSVIQSALYQERSWDEGVEKAVLQVKKLALDKPRLKTLEH